MTILLRWLRPPWTFRAKLFVLFAVFTVLVSATYTGIHIFQEVHAYRLRAREKSRLLASNLANSVRLPLYAGDRERLGSLAAETAAYPGVRRVVVVDLQGRVVAEGGHPGNRADDVAVSSIEVVPALVGTPGDPLFVPGGSEKGPLGRVTVVLDGRELTAAIRSMIMTSAATALLFCLVITAISYLVIYWLTRSLGLLTEGIRAIEEGNYAFRIAAGSRDEIGEVARAVNELAAELSRREQENKKLQQELVNSMQREMSEERKSMMAKMIQTNRMTSLGLLVSSMAHEINTPNGAIKLAGQQIAKAWKSAIPILDGVAREEGDFLLGGGPYSMVREEVLSATGAVGRSCEKIQRVIQDLRAFSTGAGGELRGEVTLAQVVADAVEIIRAHGRYGNISLQSRLEDDLPKVTGNQHQLGQVVVNLLLNGMQAMPEGREGVVAIEAEADVAHNEVALRVIDNGEGIAPEHLSQLVEPFFSTRMEKGGSGLGLYISNFIIAEHGGRLEFDSRVGQGTTITIRLPIYPGR